VPGKHFNNIKRTYKYVHGEDDPLIAKTDYSAEAAAVEKDIPQVYFTVSDYEVDIDSLRKHWLGRAAPRKDGVVKICKDPKDPVTAKILYSRILAAVVNGGDNCVVNSVSDNDLQSILEALREQRSNLKHIARPKVSFKYDTMQLPFVEFSSAIALLIYIGQDDNHVVLDTDYDDKINGDPTVDDDCKLGSSTSNGDSSLDTKQQQQQQQQRQQRQQQSKKRVVWSIKGRAASKDDKEIIQFLQKVSSTTDTLLPLGQLHTTTTTTTTSVSSTTTTTTASTDPNGQLRLVLFCRVPDEPFVYCGEVECYHHEYVWRDGEEVGSIRLSLNLLDWSQLYEKLQHAYGTSQTGVLSYFLNHS
jgi:hypothetical protein